MKIAVAGGTGVTGRHVTESVRAAGHTAVVLSRSAGVDLMDGRGLADALRGVSAVIDVTHPEPLPAHSPLYDLPNVFLTPHVAGSHGNELSRMGLFMVEEAERYVAGEPLRHRVDSETLGRQA